METDHSEKKCETDYTELFSHFYFFPKDSQHVSVPALIIKMQPDACCLFMFHSASLEHLFKLEQHWIRKFEKLSHKKNKSNFKSLLYFHLLSPLYFLHLLSLSV